MIRTVLALALACLAPAAARAEILPTFSGGRCETAATHVVVVDPAGKVLESWRGDLKPGDLLPVKEFHLPLAGVEFNFFREGAAPQKLSGDRRALFLIRGVPYFDRGHQVGGWSPANWMGEWNVSALWLEAGNAYGLEQWMNPGPQHFSRFSSEAEAKQLVLDANKAVADLFAKARAERALVARAELLAGVARKYPGFAPEALAALEWCGADAVRPVGALVGGKEPTADHVIFGGYETLVKIGAPARAELVAQMRTQLPEWERLNRSIEWANKLDRHEARLYRLLLVVTANPDALAGPTADEVKVVRETRDLWAKHPVLSKLGERGDRIADSLDRALTKPNR